MIPAHEPTRAYNAVTTAASVNDASTPDELLGIGTRRAEKPLLSPLALQQWESDGGAQPPPPTGAPKGPTRRIRGPKAGSAAIAMS